MKLIEEWTEDSAFTFIDTKSDEEVEALIEEYGCDSHLIESELEKQYPKEEYFVLVDFVEENNGWFNIRVWKKEQKKEQKKQKELEVNLTEQDLQNLMHGRDFHWEFDGVKIHLFQGEEQ